MGFSIVFDGLRRKYATAPRTATPDMASLHHDSVAMLTRSEDSDVAWTFGLRNGAGEVANFISDSPT